MGDVIQAELARLHEYAEASGKPFEEVAAETVVHYRRSLRETRRALRDIRDHQHYELNPLAMAAQ